MIIVKKYNNKSIKFDFDNNEITFIEEVAPTYYNDGQTTRSIVFPMSIFIQSISDYEKIKKLMEEHKDIL